MSEQTIDLPFPCLNLVGCAVLEKELGKVNPFQDQFDPVALASRTFRSTRGLFERSIRMPDNLIRIRAITEHDAPVDDVFDQISMAAIALLEAVESYQERFWIEKDGVYVKERPTVSEAQASYKSLVRGQVQQAFVSYQLRTLWRAKSVLRSNVFKSPHPGFFAPLIPDPSLKTDEVGVPIDIFPIFEDQDALFLRHPVLEVMFRLKPVKISQRVVGLNPRLFDAIAGDADGDTGYVTPIPKLLDVADGEDGLPDPASFDNRNRRHELWLQTSEAMALVGKTDRSGAAISTARPADIAPLTLRSMLDGSFADAMGQAGVRSYKNPLNRVLSHEELWHEAIGAASRCNYEKQAVARADAIRRNLEVVLDLDQETLESVNRFCSRLSQNAVSAAKHNTMFPLDDYVAVFQGRVRGPKGNYIRARSLDELKMALRSITDEFIEDGEFILEQLWNTFPQFQQGGLREVVTTCFPFWAMVSDKQKYDGKRIPGELRCVLNAISGQQTNSVTSVWI